MSNQIKNKPGSSVIVSIITLCLFVVGGCAQYPVSAPPMKKESSPTTKQQPHPVNQRAQGKQRQTDYGSLEPIVLPSPKTGPATPLYNEALQHISSGNFHNAELALERALRIEPRNGYYWYRLALAKFEQGQFKQAQQLCYKARAMAGGDQALLNAVRVLQNHTNYRLK